MKLVIREKDNLIYFITYEDEKLKAIDVTSKSMEYFLGNFYVGKVKNIVKNINIAFVEFAKDELCFLALNEVKTPVLLNREYDGKGLKANDEVLVQIIGETVGDKKPRATTNFEYSGRNVVLNFGKSGVSLSKKISDESARDRLKSVLDKYNDGGKFILARTSAATSTDSQIEEEVEKFIALNESITNKAMHLNCFSKVYGLNNEFEAMVLDGLNRDYEKIITDSEEIFGKIIELNKEYDVLEPDRLNEIINLYDVDTTNALYNLDVALDKALARTVWLKSGGNIVIEQTESLVAIDVNSKKAIEGKKDLEKTFFKVNCEAAMEICRQLVLKNLSGIIIVDFIDMKDEEHKKELEALLKSQLMYDPVKAVFVDFTKLNLVELTRKKVKVPFGYKLRMLKNIIGKS